jgi:hypothetical protein
MIKVNKPNVTIVIGNVSTTKIGFNTAFTIPRTTPTIIAIPKLSKVTPGRIYEEIKTARPLMRMFISRLTS